MRVIARRLLVAFLSLSAILTAVPAQAAGSWHRNAAPAVLDPAVRPYGHTYGEWSAAWWRYVLSVPFRVNPLNDPSGRNCARGQRGRVFFLVGTTTSGTTTRYCRVPAGRALFFPIINNEAENTIQPGDAPTSYTFEELSKFCRDGIDPAHDIAAEIDGRPVADLAQPTRYRAAAPAFAVTPSRDNLLEHNGYIAPAGQRIFPVAADGIYLMLAPMRPGRHTLHFHASGSLDLDVTYHLWIG